MGSFQKEQKEMVAYQLRSAGYSLIQFMDPITEQNSGPGYHGNSEKNNGGYSSDCFSSSDNLPRRFSLSAGRSTTIVSIIHILPPRNYIIYLLFRYE